MKKRIIKKQQRREQDEQDCAGDVPGNFMPVTVTETNPDGTFDHEFVINLKAARAGKENPVMTKEESVRVLN